MLEINNLKVKYNHEAVLRGIDLELKEKETIALVGESGAGKTTLGLSVIGLCPGEVMGTIKFKGRNIPGLSGEELRSIRWKDISIVFQDVAGSLNPLYTAYDQVLEPVLVHGADRARAGEVVKNLFMKVGLEDTTYRKYPHQLSGGEQQKVMIAMAMANDPALIILDEPTSSLDSLTRREILRLLQQTALERSLLIITHDFSTAAKLAERIAVIYQGKIVEEGKTDDIINNPCHPYTKGLLRAYPSMRTTKDLQGVPGKASPVCKGCSFYPRCSQRIDLCMVEEPLLQMHGQRRVACHRGGVVTALEVRELGKNYDGQAVLKMVSFTLREGDTLALVGESGAGKTTLARSIMGLETPDSGTIYFEGEPVYRRDKDFFRNIQMIFQTPRESISHRLSVLDTVTEPLLIQKLGSEEDRKEKALQVLAEVELPNNELFLKRYAHHLSGGEQQRLSIARALILEPKILIADECTSALDASIQAKIVRLLLDLQESRGLSMLFITHDLALARKVSDYVAVIRHGEIMEITASSEIFERPKTEYTRKLIGAAPDLAQITNVD